LDFASSVILACSPTELIAVHSSLQALNSLFWNFSHFECLPFGQSQKVKLEALAGLVSC